MEQMMPMHLWILFAVIVGLAGYQVWLWFKNRPAPITVAEPFAIRGDTPWSDIEDWVEGYKDWWPHLRRNPWFWVGICTSSISFAFAVAGGFSLGEGAIFYGVLAAAVLAVFQLGQAVVSLSGDKGGTDGLEFNTADRSMASWGLLVMLICGNVFGAFLGSAMVGSTIETQGQINAANTSSLMSEHAEIEARIRSVSAKISEAGMEPAAIEEQAKFAEREWICESWRGGGNRFCPENILSDLKDGKLTEGPKCGSACTSKKEEAVKWRALANEAASLPKLKERSEDIKAAQQAGGSRVEASPGGARFEEITQGVVPAAVFQKWAFLVFQIVLVFADALIWLQAGAMLAMSMRKEFAMRAERGNAMLADRKLPPRWNVPTEPVALLTSSTSGDTITVTVSEDAQKKIDSSDTLTEIDQFFKSQMIAEANAEAASGKMYQVYDAIKRGENAKTWQTQTSFLASLKEYCLLKGIRWNGSKVGGYRIKFAATEEMVAAE